METMRSQLPPWFQVDEITSVVKDGSHLCKGRDWIRSACHFTKGISILKEDGSTAILAGVAAVEDIIV
jgi:hypothetical protein